MFWICFDDPHVTARTTVFAVYVVAVIQKLLCKLLTRAITARHVDVIACFLQHFVTHPAARDTQHSSHLVVVNDLEEKVEQRFLSLRQCNCHSCFCQNKTK